MSMGRVFCFFGHAALGGCAGSVRTGSMACTPRTGGIALKDCPRWKPSASQPAHFRYWRETDVAVATFDVCFVGAGSTGRRNTGVKSLCWGFKLQGLTWSFIELTSHFVQIGLRVHRQVGALRKVLSQQAIGVLVRPALPRALRIERLVTAYRDRSKAGLVILTSFYQQHIHGHGQLLL